MRPVLLSLALLLVFAGSAQAGERWFPQRVKRATFSSAAPVVLHGQGVRAHRKPLDVQVFIDGIEHVQSGMPWQRWCQFFTHGRGGSRVRVNLCGRAAWFAASTVSGRHRVVVRWTFRP